MSVDFVLTSQIPDVLAALPDRVGAILDQAAGDVAADWASHVRVDTGAFRDSIHVEADGSFVRIVADGVEYGVYNELGTSKMSAQPDLTMALAREEGRLPERFEAALKP